MRRTAAAFGRHLRAQLHGLDGLRIAGIAQQHGFAFLAQVFVLLLMASVSVLAQERCAWRASEGALRSAPDIGNGDGLAVHRPSSSPRPWAELFSMRPSGPQTLSALVQAGAAPGSRRARSQPRRSTMNCAPASPSSAGRPPAHRRPRLAAPPPRSPRRQPARRRGSGPRSAGAGPVARARRPAPAPAPARASRADPSARPLDRPGTTAPLPAPAPPACLPRRSGHRPAAADSPARARCRRRSAPRQRPAWPGRPAARRRHAPRASAARPPAGCRTGPDPARWASAAGLPRARRVRPRPPVAGRAVRLVGRAAQQLPVRERQRRTLVGSGPRLGQQHARMRPADARAQRDGRQRQGDAPATPTPRRQGQQHGRRHLRAGPGQPPPGMRADRQVRVIAPGKGPMGHRQRLAPARRNPAPAAAPARPARRRPAPRRDAPACRHGNPYPPRAATAMRRPGPMPAPRPRPAPDVRRGNPAGPASPVPATSPRPPARPPRPASRPKPRPAARARPACARQGGARPGQHGRWRRRGRQRHRHGTHHVASRPSSAKARCRNAASFGSPR